MEPSDLGTTAQVMEVFSALAPMFQKVDPTLKLAPDPRATKKLRKAAPNKPCEEVEDQEMVVAEQPLPVLQMLRMLTQLVIRHDQEIQSLRRTDQFILCLNPEPQGAMQVLLTETAQWKKKMDSSSTAQMMPLRQHLMIALLNALKKRAGQVIECPTTDQLYQTSLDKGLILQDRSFPFHRWDGQTNQLILDKKAPISAKKMGQHLDELLEMFMDKELVVRFHALRAPLEQQQKIVPWRLQLNLRSDRPYELLYQMAYNSIWMLVGGA